MYYSRGNISKHPEADNPSTTDEVPAPMQRVRCSEAPLYMEFHILEQISHDVSSGGHLAAKAL